MQNTRERRAPGFLARANGLIINIAFIVARAPALLKGVYSGTKAYVVNLTPGLQAPTSGTAPASPYGIFQSRRS
jgi:short-subunit dehydrogenase